MTEVQVVCDNAAEKVMLERVFDAARAFYKDPNNLKAFKAWKKEEKTHAKNHINP